MSCPVTRASTSSSRSSSIINAATFASAVAALARKLKTGWQYARDVIEVIQRRHKPIAQYFCADMGIRLMNIEAGPLAPVAKEDLVGLIDARIEQLQAEGDTSAAEAETPAAEAEAPAAAEAEAPAPTEETEAEAPAAAAEPVTNEETTPEEDAETSEPASEEE